MTQLAVALLFPPDIANSIEKVRGEFGSARVRSVVPHITLVYPFTPTSPTTTIITRLNDVGQRIAPFVVSLDRVSYFESPTIVAYLSVIDNGETMRLHRALADSLRGLCQSELLHFENQNFVPHVSINDEISAEQLAQLKLRLDSLRLDLKPLIDHFCLFQNDGDGWRIAEIIRLSGN